MRQAFAVAQSGVPGPVFIEFPIDTLYPYKNVMAEVAQPVCAGLMPQLTLASRLNPAPQTKAGSGGLSIAQRLTNWYLQRYVNNIFSGALNPPCLMVALSLRSDRRLDPARHAPASCRHSARLGITGIKQGSSAPTIQSLMV